MLVPTMRALMMLAHCVPLSLTLERAAVPPNAVFQHHRPGGPVRRLRCRRIRFGCAAGLVAVPEYQEPWMSASMSSLALKSIVPT